MSYPTLYVRTYRGVMLARDRLDLPSHCDDAEQPGDLGIRHAVERSNAAEEHARFHRLLDRLGVMIDRYGNLYNRRGLLPEA